MTVDALTKLKITSSGFIVLRPDLEARIVETTSRGENELWSSQNLDRQLRLLESLVPKTVCYPSVNFRAVSSAFRPKQAFVRGLTPSYSVHLQCYHQICAWFSTWNAFQPRLSARRARRPFPDL
jgi:hypothetical protein